MSDRLDHDLAAPDGAGGDVTALRRGTGPDVVMIHGAYTNARDWRASGLIDAVAGKGFRATALDRPDQGASRTAPGAAALSPSDQAKRLAAAARAMTVEKPILIAHSLGAAVALAWALDAPDDIRGLLLIAGATHPWGGGDESWHNRLATTPWIGNAFIHGVIATAGKARIVEAAKAGFAPDTPPEGYAETACAADAVRPGAYRATARTLMRFDHDLRRQALRYGALKTPIRAVTGAVDSVVSPWIHSRALAFDAPNARAVVLPGHGHNLHHARPDVILELLDELHAIAPLSVDG